MYNEKNITTIKELGFLSQIKQSLNFILKLLPFNKLQLIAYLLDK